LFSGNNYPGFIRRKIEVKGIFNLINSVMIKMKRFRVIDFFCGAGGFSEGFKQLGFDIVYGFDHWRPAVETFNYNFNLNCSPKNILDFKNSIEEIEKLPDTEVIIGSPPCVSFSSSNKSGQADKSLGVELTETFLRIIAVKRHKPNSILKAWFMENVVNSKRYLQSAYTFKDLGLTDWANKYRISPLKIAVELYDNTAIINSADYGSFQARKRLISGEIIKRQKLILPQQTHSDKNEIDKAKYNSIKQIKNSFPTPFHQKSIKKIKDPQYQIELPLDKIFDHFYDTGVYQAEWEFSKYWKTNHPYMGKMAFPENENKPSRTITATKIANSRESIIYKSEIQRIGNGEYRLPTVREAAIYMGFPITYQFIGSENTKWRLVGNAVCCSVGRAFASTVLSEYRVATPKALIVNNSIHLKGVPNLNTFQLKTFDKPPIKNNGARFRRHPIKEGNLTVTLSNYDIEKNSQRNGKWYTSIQYGTGKGFPIQKVRDNFFKQIEIIVKKYPKGNEFISIINNGYSEKIPKSSTLQKLYEQQNSTAKYTNPTKLVDEIAAILESLDIDNQIFKQEERKIFIYKDVIPLKQLFALYAVNVISTKTNSI
jgi:DNA (cytosine-5)-methyltransferase 1